MNFPSLLLKLILDLVESSQISALDKFGNPLRKGQPLWRSTQIEREVNLWRWDQIQSWDSSLRDEYFNWIVLFK